MHAATISKTAPWTAHRLATAQYIKIAHRSLLAPLLVILQKPVYILAIRKRLHFPSRRPQTPRLSCPYAMLVESDVQPGMRGVLP